MKKVVCIVTAICFLILSMAGEIERKRDVSAKEPFQDGVYSIPVSLWNATKEEASLGNGAIEQTGKLEIRSGKCKLYIGLQSLSMMGLQGYLMELDVLENVVLNANQYPIQYDYKETTVVSEYDVVDLYNGKDSQDEVCRGKKYPKVVALSVEGGETYTWAHVYVPVMGSLGFGNQLCRIKLDYDHMREMTEEEKELWEKKEESSKETTTPEPSKSPAGTTTSEPSKSPEESATSEPSKSPEESAAPEPSKSPAGVVTPDPSKSPAGTTTSEPSKSPAGVVTPDPSKSPAGTATQTPDSGMSSGESEWKDGKYTVQVALWKENADELSMGNPALQSKAMVIAKNKKLTMEIGTKIMTVGTVDAGLHSFQVQQKDGSYVYATVKKRENVLNGKKIPSVFSFSLNGKQDKIPVKIDPQVAIMNNQVMDARLKIDWSTLKKVADDTRIEKEEPEKNTTSAKPFYGKDKKTKVILQGKKNVLSSENVLSVKVRKKATLGKKTRKKLTSLGGKYKVYEITVYTKDKKKVVPNGMVTISIPVPKTYTVSGTQGYRIENGNTIKLNGSVKKGRYVFETNTLGSFALVHTKKETTTKKKEKSSSRESTGKSIFQEEQDENDKTTYAANTQEGETVSGTDKTDAAKETVVTDTKQESLPKENALSGSDVEETKEREQKNTVLAGMVIAGSMVVSAFMVAVTVISLGKYFLEKEKRGDRDEKKE